MSAKVCAYCGATDTELIRTVTSVGLPGEWVCYHAVACTKRSLVRDGVTLLPREAMGEAK